MFKELFRMSIIRKVGWLVFILSMFANTVYAADEKLSGREIVSQCDIKYPGEDQTSELTISMKDKSGNQRKTVYFRVWKDLKGAEGIVDKMTLFTVFPPDAKGAAFMRVAYKEKNAEQSIYLPNLRKIRKVSVRDLSDSFLGSDLTYGDISYRAISEDTHNYVRTDRDKQGSEFFVVESIPKEAKPQYSKKISWFHNTKKPAECVKVRVDYFDTKGALLKRQRLKWQKVDDAWVWDKVLVENAQTFHSSFFEVKKVKINTNVDEDWFSERRLRLGLE